MKFWILEECRIRTAIVDRVVVHSGTEEVLSRGFLLLIWLRLDWKQIEESSVHSKNIKERSWVQKRLAEAFSM